MDANTHTLENSAALQEEAFDRLLDSVTSRPSHREIFRKTLLCCASPVETAELQEHMTAFPEFPHAGMSQRHFIGLLVERGGLERLEFTQQGEEVTAEMKEGLDEDELEELVWRVDYLTTPTGMAVVEELDPMRRLENLFSEAPDRLSTYADLLNFCREPQTYQAVEKMLEDQGGLGKSINPRAGIAMQPSAYLGKLESAGGIVWDGGWKVTEEGSLWLERLEDFAKKLVS